MGSHYKIRTEKTGHFFMHGTMTAQTQYVWICLHGYGQLARYFISHFEFLDPNKNLVIVPEGLNRFYLDEKHLRPAAHWLTREDRLDEIADFILFLESLRSKLSWDKNQEMKIIYFGFSQGATSLMRWLTTIHPRIDYLLLWAGDIPNDILFESSRSYFEKINAHYFLGDKDQYFSEDLMINVNGLMEKTGLHPQRHTFSGDHRIDNEVLKEFCEKWL